MNNNEEFKKICVIVDGYPTPDNPQFAFIRPVVCAMTDNGIECSVIAPQSLTRILTKRDPRRPRFWIDTTDAGNQIKVYQPYTITLSTFVSTYKLTEQVIKRTYFKEKINADVLYGHFWSNGFRAASIAQIEKKPVIVVSGEADIARETPYSKQEICERTRLISGVICVSGKNLEESRGLGLILEKVPAIVLPNGIEPSKFYRIAQEKARKDLQLSKDDFIGIAVGEYSYRKGTERIIEAARKVPELKLVLIGAGDTLCNTEQVILSGCRPHDELVKYLNAADFFILPTLAEGCCNAIVEAMACGLPVISSALPFNEGLLNESNSILVDPLNIDAIAEAILRLKDSKELRKNMSECSVNMAEDLTINKRAVRIIRFIRECCQRN